MNPQKCIFLAFCILAGFCFLTIPTLSENITGSNIESSQISLHPTDQYGNEFGYPNQFLRNGTSYARNESYPADQFPERIHLYDGGLRGLEQLNQNWKLPGLSIGVSLIILIIMIIAGITAGAVYQYNCSRRASYMLAGCHVISTLLIGAFIFALYTMGTAENNMDPFVNTMYATFGILTYLTLSSLIQAVSILKSRPLVPLHQAHILFSVIAIILLLSVRVPAFFSLQISMVTALTIITPGAAFSLISSHFIQKIEQTDSRHALNQTITRSLPLIKQELPPSFPEKLTLKYHDISVIGSGGMAIVYRATRNSDGKVIALKIPFSTDEISGKTFLNEMSVWRDLSHPHIARITDQNIFPVPYVELEYIPRSLKDLTLPVPPKRALQIIRQVGSALAYAHENGVIHRDIKPGNVLIHDDGTAKLTDWGLSRFIERADDTRNTSFSLFYASPEQLAPEKYGNGDQRTDIYQLGVLLYELICGTPPYGTQNIGELYARIQKNQYILPSAVKAELMPFDEIITRSLKADPSERFQIISEFLAMQDIISGEEQDETT